MILTLRYESPYAMERYFLRDATNRLTRRDDGFYATERATERPWEPGFYAKER